MRRALGLLGLCITLAAPWGALAQPAPVPPYKPGLGDLMTMTVQPRHTKLGLAGRAENWPYATYELHELQESLDRVARLSPQWRNFAVAETMQSVTKEPMAGLAEAIKNADAGRFAKAYKELTDACNLCHQSAGQGVIVIQVPTASPFPDQVFQPARR